MTSDIPLWGGVLWDDNASRALGYDALGWENVSQT